MKTVPVIVIPSLEPDNKLPELIGQLCGCFSGTIIVVDDGSGDGYRHIFTDIANRGNCTVLRHTVNQGKGRALKTAFNHILCENMECSGVITVDSDGQHRPDDIMKIAAGLKSDERAIWLGSRDFSGKDVPFKSRFGNTLTAFLFKIFTSVKVKDTQTGLRGIPYCLLREMLELDGERFEYEMNMLMEASRREIKIKESIIATVYLEGNASSHFNPIRDSFLIYRQLFKFALSSALSAVVDIVLFSIFLNTLYLGLDQKILYSTISARVLSSLFNYLTNKNIVFGKKGSIRKTMAKYYILAFIQMLVSFLLVQVLNNITGFAPTLVKIVVDSVLFFISFRIQRNIVFK